MSAETDGGTAVSALGPDRGSAGRGCQAAIADGEEEEPAVGSENLESVGQSGELWQVKRRWDFFFNRSMLHLNENSRLVGGGEINICKEECLWVGR